MIDDIQFTEVDGLHNALDVVVYALSTCGHCKRALKFLNENSVKYKYVYVDLLPLEKKTELKEYLASKYNTYVAFPLLIINDTVAYAGFIEEQWRQLLKLE